MMSWPHRKPVTGTYLCPLCAVSARTDVIDSRPTPDGFQRRRRYCNECKQRFTTIEIPDEVFTNETAKGIALQMRKARTALNAFIAEFNLLNKHSHNAAKRKG